MAHPRPAEPQQVAQEVEVSHGLLDLHHSFPGFGRLVCCPRFERRIFLYINIPRTQMLSVLLGGDHSLPVYGAPLQPCNGTRGVYQMHVGSGHLPQALGNPDLPIPEGLAHQGTLQVLSPARCQSAAGFGLSSGSVSVSPGPEDRVNRCGAGLY